MTTAGQSTEGGGGEEPVQDPVRTPLQEQDQGTTVQGTPAQGAKEQDPARKTGPEAERPTGPGAERPRVLRDASLSAVFAGLVTVTVSCSGPLLVVLAAAAAGH
nr:hypothetical protein [Streptomyces sp. DSM 41633]